MGFSLIDVNEIEGGGPGGAFHFVRRELGVEAFGMRTPRKLRAKGAVLNHTLELNDEELRLLKAALNAHLHDFGHDEADVLRSLKELIARLPTPGVPDE